MGRVVRGANCPWGELSVGRTVRGANCPWGELSVGQTVRGANCPWSELSVGRTVRGASCRGASFDGASGQGTFVYDVQQHTLPPCRIYGNYVVGGFRQYDGTAVDLF
jgi:hypothetical protein